MRGRSPQQSQSQPSQPTTAPPSASQYFGQTDDHGTFNAPESQDQRIAQGVSGGVEVISGVLGAIFTGQGAPAIGAGVQDITGSIEGQRTR